MFNDDENVVYDVFFFLLIITKQAVDWYLGVVEVVADVDVVDLDEKKS